MDWMAGWMEVRSGGGDGMLSIGLFFPPDGRRRVL